MRVLLLGPLIFFVLPAITNASPASDARKAIVTEIQRSNTAFMRGDVAGTMADTTSDYSDYTDDGQKYNREQASQSCRFVVTSVHQIFSMSEVQQFHLISSKEALVLGTDHFTK